MIKVSIIVPAYNVQDYITRCLNSIAEQTLKEIEVLIINDGSTDRTENIISDFQVKDNRFKVFNLPNKGVSVARNFGIKNSLGNYIYQIDADDWIEKGALQALYNKAESEEADIVIANAYVDYQGNKTQLMIDGKKNSCVTSLQQVMLGDIKPCVWTKLYKRSLFIQNNIEYAEGIRIGEDLLINLQLFFYAKKVVKLEDAFLHYVQREGSVSNISNEKQNDIYLVLKNIKDFLMVKGLYSQYKDEYLFLVYLHTYYYKVILSEHLNSFHKEMYLKFMSNRKLYQNNKYINRLKSDQTYKEKVLTFLYDRSYILGYITRNLSNKLKK
ncbi:glycosyltransferase family 2 protein [Priestia megaterium]|uniref:glycosyltransferase family 2 protein n=1 Tax=Priestia megaterium TaxID=1404 RepID=UPI000472AF94|nr:glycosyltransferase family 2 protein [Priestia megaterium]